MSWGKLPTWEDYFNPEEKDEEIRALTARVTELETLALSLKASSTVQKRNALQRKIDRGEEILKIADRLMMAADFAAVALQEAGKRSEHLVSCVKAYRKARMGK